MSRYRILDQHKELVHAIEDRLHINLYEHKYSFALFIGSFALFAALGTACGGLLDKAIVKLQGTSEDKGSCGKFLFVNVLIDGIAFYIVFTLKKSGMRFDDWMMGTFNGFIFALTLFSAQEKLTTNMKCLTE